MVASGPFSSILRQVILKAAGLPITDRISSDQIRVNTINNTVLISTPNMGRADLYHSIQSRQFNGNPYEVATHVADPIDTCRGYMHLPPDYSEDDIASTLRRCNPTLIIGGARRLGNTETIMVIFQGKTIPFYVNYDGCSLRCCPFRQKVEACTRCRGIGHRQDVCTNATDTLCPKCGMKDHECDPICVVCNGNHQTGSSLCKQRFKSHPTRLRHKQDTSPTNRTPGLDHTRDSSRRRSHSKSKDRGPGYATLDVTWPALSSSPTLANSSSNPPQVSWAKVASSSCSSNQTANNESLLEENTILNAEIQRLKLELQPRHPSTSTSEAPLSNTTLSTHHPSALPETSSHRLMDTSPSTEREPLHPPPSKRKTPSTPQSEDTLDETILYYNNRLTALETKFHNILTAIEKNQYRFTQPGMKSSTNLLHSYKHTFNKLQVG
ncbi:uncharacterized protein LOC142592783 isoform X1 [Dermacentor variabilis]|uniref:uncharacterized protein LOC142592783 isoform X1 n=1 Tax=Dermacentor variabilis TaxID=34621 RepID=UPI003F5B7855